MAKSGPIVRPNRVKMSKSLGKRYVLEMQLRFVTMNRRNPQVDYYRSSDRKRNTLLYKKYNFLKTSTGFLKFAIIDGSVTSL